MGPWADHGQSTGGYYSCNKFKAGAKTDVGDERSKAKADSEKYIWYFTRFDNHEKAGRFAAKHREAAQRVRGAACASMCTHLRRRQRRVPGGSRCVAGASHPTPAPPG